MKSVSSIRVVMISMSLLSWMASMSHSLSPPPHVSRSQFLSRLALSSVFLAPSPSLSLDADAFAAAELRKDAPRKGYSGDEALCLFGQASGLRAEACTRSNLTPKSGLDPSGKVDRGEFSKCKKEYVMNGQGTWEPSWTCTGQ